MIFYNNANCNIVFWHWEIYFKRAAFLQCTNIKKGRVARQTNSVQHYYIRRAPRGKLLFPPRPPCSEAASSAMPSNGLYIRAGTAVPLPTFAITSQKFPHTPGASLAAFDFAAYCFGQQEFILLTALTCARGPDRAMRLSRKKSA